MNVVACYKIVSDPQDVVRKDNTRELDFNRAAKIIGEYDFVAIEEAVRLAEEINGRPILLSVGGNEVTDSKLIKSALSRGAEELFSVIDEALAHADSYQTAFTLAQALNKIDYDLVICGEGSADLYGQQVGTLLGSIMGVTTLNAVSKIEVQQGELVAERSLESEVEVIKVQTPAVLSVTSDINLPRIPQLKDILAAGKKPVTTWGLSDIDTMPASKVECVSLLAPESVERKCVIYENASAENIQKLALDIKAAV